MAILKTQKRTRAKLTSTQKAERRQKLANFTNAIETAWDAYQEEAREISQDYGRLVFHNTKKEQTYLSHYRKVFEMDTSPTEWRSTDSTTAQGQFLECFREHKTQWSQWKYVPHLTRYQLPMYLLLQLVGLVNGTDSQHSLLRTMPSFTTNIAVCRRPRKKTEARYRRVACDAG